MNHKFDKTNSVSYYNNLISDDPNNNSACLQSDKFLQKYGSDDKRFLMHINNCKLCQEKYTSTGII